MPTSLLTLSALLTVIPCVGQPPESKTLLQRIEPWRYPDAEMGPATMQDGATVNASGDRTCVSLHCRTSFVTPDTADKVLAHYERLLQRPDSGKDATGLAAAAGRAVHVVRGDGDHPVHLLSVYESSITTTVQMIGGDQTRIRWSQFERIDINTIRQ
ncbi:MAG: hypothetical protein NXI04_10265 [Planctomycetaceae bacterium]|nr:hypothetical protein [Planctomycetaceae bacterium]